MNDDYAQIGRDSAIEYTAQGRRRRAVMLRELRHEVRMAASRRRRRRGTLITALMLAPVMAAAVVAGQTWWTNGGKMRQVVAAPTVAAAHGSETAVRPTAQALTNAAMPTLRDGAPPGPGLPIDHDMTPHSALARLIVQTPPGCADKYRVETPTDMLTQCLANSDAWISKVQFMNDEQLLQALQAIGRPSGLIRIHGQARLTAAVTDAKLWKNDG